MIRQINFSRPAATGTGQNDALVKALLKQALSGARIRHPLQGFDQLGKSALAAFLQRKDEADLKTQQEEVQSTLAEALKAGQGQDILFSQAGPKQFNLPAGTGISDVAALGPAIRGNLPVISGVQTDQNVTIPGDFARSNQILAGSVDPRLQQLALARQLQGKTGAGFSLSAGQSRFGPGGDLLASLPAKGNLLPPDEEEQKIRIAKAGRAPGGVTPTQFANNEEIGAARGRLLALRLKLQPGETLRDLVLRRTQRADDTGLGNPGFDPLISRDLRLASQRMVGDDPGFGEFFDQLDVGASLPAAGPAPVPEPEGPGLVSRAIDALFGGDEASAAVPATPAPRGRGRFPRGGRPGGGAPDPGATPGTIPRTQASRRGPRGRVPTAANKSISQMSVRELTDLLDKGENNLAPAVRQQINTRLRALGL